MSMFYSHLLLSKKGPLGTIWIAAHFHRRLTKNLVQQTNISSSVDKILLHEVPLVTYRILAYLLLGVVRIYSKKVEYLFHDSNYVLNEIRHFACTKTTSTTHVEGMCTPQSARKKRATTSNCVEAMCAPYSAVTLPEKFELDAFNLEVIENASGDHVKPREEIMLDDAMENDRTRHHSLDKDHCGEVSASFEDFSAAYTPLTDIPSPQHTEENMVVCQSHTLNNSEASMEKFRDNRFSLEDRLDPMIFGEGEEESYFARPFDKAHETEGEHGNSSVAEMIFGEDEEPPDQYRSFDEEQHRNAEKRMLSEMTSLETEKLHVTPDNRPVSMTVDVTTESKVPNASGVPTPEFLAVRTPAPRERARVSRKRKCLSDDVIVLPNKVFSEWIHDSSDLVCKRRKAPHTALHAWKSHRVFNLPQSFLEPIIPSFSLDIRPLICKKKLETPEPLKSIEIPAKVDKLGFPTIHASLEEEAIAPSTPVTHSVRGISKTDGAGPTSSIESIEKELSRSELGESDKILMNEDLNSYEGDSQENSLVADKWSARTGIVARYLHRNFLSRLRRREEEAVNLSQLLKGKTKKESSRLFYELLVLKTGGYADVKQDKPYDDIYVVGTSKFKKACEVD